ncbi:MAG: DUF58 domain-containing protein [Epsilonproteobacteria bacterium]|nr:DUF58 domain-containing protein [Campylobacterota bacterium]
MSIPEIIIKAKKQSNNLFSGNFASTHFGGMEFDSLREYQIGDNVKRIDYNITAKMQKPYVKVFRDETELNVVIVGILDYKTYFGSKVLKYEKIIETIATLGFNSVKYNKTSIEIYSKQNIIIPPTKNQKALSKLAAFDENIMHTQIDYTHILNQLMRHRKNSVLIVVSDFFYRYNFAQLGAKFDMYAIVIRDILEENPTALNTLPILSPITKKFSIANFDNRYKAQILAHDSELFTNFKRSNISYIKLYTHDSILKIRSLFG